MGDETSLSWIARNYLYVGKFLGPEMNLQNSAEEVQAHEITSAVQQSIFFRESLTSTDLLEDFREYIGGKRKRFSEKRPINLYSALIQWNAVKDGGPMIIRNHSTSGNESITLSCSTLMRRASGPPKPKIRNRSSKRTTNCPATIRLYKIRKETLDSLHGFGGKQTRDILSRMFPYGVPDPLPFGWYVSELNNLHLSHEREQEDVNLRRSRKSEDVGVDPSGEEMNREGFMKLMEDIYNKFLLDSSENYKLAMETIEGLMRILQEKGSGRLEQGTSSSSRTIMEEGKSRKSSIDPPLEPRRNARPGKISVLELIQNQSQDNAS